MDGETARRTYVASTQVNLLRQRFEQAFGAEYHKFVDIDTIDGFQASRHASKPCCLHHSSPTMHDLHAWLTLAMSQSKHAIALQ